ncbi:agmatinase [Virgibacillus sp. W0181]|uniref:agmatinase n=1 Tax=Virgibacillus sp. W0181 TaxID=3391581 RepID=UPI003F45F2A3
MTNDTWSSVLHGGISTFMKTPIIQPKRDIIKNEGVKAAVIGIPFDGTTITRPGSTMGPRKFRDVSSSVIPYHFDYDVDVVKAFNLKDCGDVDVKIGSGYETVQRGKDSVLEILHGGAMPVIVGGEHLVTVSGTKAVNEFNPSGNYGFIMFDAHFDTATDIDGDKWSHCCPVTRTMELNCFKPENTVIIGPHGPTNPKAELEYVIEQNISYFTMRDIYKQGIEKIIEEAIKIASKDTDGIYISIDMDCLDSSHSPGTVAPTPGGMTTREMILAIERLGKEDVIGLDVVEFAPPYDHPDITAISAVRFVVDFLGSIASRKNN